MHKLGLALIIITVVLSALLLVFRQMPKAGEAPGLVNDRLARCPQTPNCVCSEFTDDSDHFIEPFQISQDASISVLTIKSTIEALGGQVVIIEHDYLAATFTSRIFRFVDDVEIRIDTAQQLIHMRSASRLGRSDFGVNRKRIERIKSLIAGKLD